jgi:outer membrane protein
MKKYLLFIALIFVALPSGLISQRVAFINSQIIRSKFSESQQAEQRIRSFVDEWKRELNTMQKNVETLQFEINKNRLIWTEDEKGQKDKSLKDLTEQSEAYAKSKFSPNGEYDMIVRQIMNPIEQKISAAIQKVSNRRKFDIVFDQSVQPLAYVNFKYDLTLEVLRELGVDVEELEKELQEKISKDPGNQKKESTTPRRVSRTKSKTETEERQFDNPEITPTPLPIDSVNVPPQELQKPR